ncbi:phosphatase PAP2 family protein [Pseudoroseomonas globiformis]|uniref:Phosphatase PAP2 family protein n=1 Tax=Teichococcus globiformis TaxID=2307229 RepID=A0ABV7G8Z8_9PROT
MEFLTDFADQAVILPAFVALTLTLLSMQWRHGVLPWTLAVAGTLGFVFLAKVTTYAFPGLIGAVDGPWALHSPSGHVASAAILYGGLAVLLLKQRPVALALAMGIAIVMAGTRLALQVHTVADVVAGAALGLVGVAALATLAPRQPDRLPRIVLPAVLFTVVVLMHGQRLTAEPTIARIAWRLSRLLES